MRSTKPIRLFEDDSVDMTTVKRSLKELNVTNQPGAAGYVVKVADYCCKFIETIRTIEPYWTLGKLAPDGD